MQVTTYIVKKPHGVSKQRILLRNQVPTIHQTITSGPRFKKKIVFQCCRSVKLTAPTFKYKRLDIFILIAKGSDRIHSGIGCELVASLFITQKFSEVKILNEDIYFNRLSHWYSDPFWQAVDMVYLSLFKHSLLPMQ